MSLHERAAQLAGRTDQPVPPTDPQPADIDAYDPEPPDVDEAAVDDPVADVPVHVAWTKLLREVRAIEKGDNFDGGRAGKFKFRGIDRVVDHFGPAIRRHGINVIPHRVEPTYRDIKTSSGGNMRECDIVVTWHIYGPRGDFIEAQTAGEGLDTGGRSTTKAQTIAERVLFLVAGVMPTRDNDPEANNIERGEAPLRSAASYRDEALDLGTSRQRMAQMLYELRQLNRAGEQVTNENGDDEQIGALILRVGRERFGGGQ